MRTSLRQGLVNLPALLGAALLLATCSVPDAVERPAPPGTGAFTPPADALPPSQTFEGYLQLQTEHAPAHMDVLADTYDAAYTAQWDITHLPPFDFAFIQDGDDVIPVRRGALLSTHPYWEWMLEPGKAWDKPAEPGWTQVSLPFSLRERNQNCTHYGLMSFRFKSNGAISSVRYQIASETCIYLKINLWGSLDAQYRPAPVPGKTQIVEDFHQLMSRRLPVKAITQINLDYPGIDPAAFIPPGPEDVTVYGLVVDGVHYRGGCETRLGPHPFCDRLDLPSYSTAKSIFAGLVFIYLEKTYPGFADISVAELVPECRLADGRWDDVTMRHLLNMSTGNYDDAGFEADEGAANVGEFFLDETHAGKIKFSCTAYPRKSPPGERFVYHTFDTYILGTAMNAFIRKKLGPDTDIFSDLLMKKILGPLHLSPTARTTMRSYDPVSQPFTGFGLSWNPDDIARIGQWLNREITAATADSLLYGKDFRDALFRHPDVVKRLSNSRGEAYKNGFWGFDVAAWIGCDHPVWVPFMSGFGGNIIALIPNDAVYYYFSDGNQFKWADAVAETRKIKNYCE